MKDISLSKGYILKGADYTYRIEGLLGQGSFGITYLATTKMKGTLGEVSVRVALKEFFAKDFNERNENGSVREHSSDSIVSRYGKDFQKEAQNLSRLKAPGIVNVLESFEANGTYYYSMEFIEGESLDAYIRKKGYLPEAEAVEAIRSIASSVDAMHSQRMLHLDLKPKNVMRREGGELLLIDFGLSKQYEDNGEPESSTSIGLGTPGYAPIEQGQQGQSREFSPTLDVYALGATLFKMLTGQTPPSSSSIFNDGFPEDVLLARGVSQNTIDACRKAMSPGKRERPQSVVEFLALLTAPSVTVQPEDDGNKEDKEDRGNKEDSEVTVFPEAEVQDKSEARGKSRNEVKDKSRNEVKDRSRNEAGDKGSKPKKKPIFPKWLIGVLVGIIPAAAAVILFALIRPDKSGTEPISSFTGIYNDHDYVDLGLSVKWATCNVGASSPEKCGDYFAWGETSPKDEYSWANLKYCNDSSGDSFSKYNGNQSSLINNKTVLDLNDDAARRNWGGRWRMPTQSEFEELIDNCTWTWTAMNGKDGYKVTSKSNGKSIFLPACGLCDGASLYYEGVYGTYWSNSLDEADSYNVRCLYFVSDEYSMDSSYRYAGQSVRPVFR